MTHKVIVVYNSVDEDDFSYDERVSGLTCEKFIEFRGINGGNDRKWYNVDKIQYMYFYEKE